MYKSWRRFNKGLDFRKKWVDSNAIKKKGKVTFKSLDLKTHGKS